MKETEINKARAIYYKIFSSFFVYSKDINKYENLLELIEVVKDNGLDSSSGEAFLNLSQKLPKDSNELLLH